VPDIVIKLRRFLRLSRDEQCLFVQAFVLFPLTRAALKCGAFKAWKAFLERWTARICHVQSTPDELSAAKRLTAIIDTAERYTHLQWSCLERSLVLWCLLRNRSLAVTLHLGARKVDGQFEAHAWVEYFGIVLNDPGGTYEDFSRFGSSCPESRGESH